MEASIIKKIVSRLSPLDPIPTHHTEHCVAPKEIKAILFDVYGTLLISGTGDIGTAVSHSNTHALDTLFHRSGFSVRSTGLQNIVQESLQTIISLEHQKMQASGIDFPEVEIRNIWSDVLEQLWNKGFLKTHPKERNTEELSFRYEMRVNPVWPMPGFPGIVQDLSDAGYRMGIISNAQFYTPPIMEHLVGKTLGDLGFEPKLCSWSYILGRAKPSPWMFRAPLEALALDGIIPQNVLYVGNDMLNDMYTASEAGCRTCLFAGDQRSLRLRKTDARCHIQPDMVISHLSRLKCFIEEGAFNA